MMKGKPLTKGRVRLKSMPLTDDERDEMARLNKFMCNCATRFKPRESLDKEES